MPCNQIITTTVALGKLKNDLALKAIAALGWKHDTSYTGLRFDVPGVGRATVRGEQITIEGTRYKVGATGAVDNIVKQLKKAYAKEVGAATLKRFGWKVESLGPDRIKATRRSM